MKNQLKLIMSFFVGTFCLLSFNVQAEEPAKKPEIRMEDCQAIFEKSGKCPTEVCSPGCLGGITYDKCKAGCNPKSCLEIESQYCPTDNCQLIVGCEGKKVCFPQADLLPPSCGGEAYSGGDAPCCSGLVKRCGIEFFDGSCDLVGKYSTYGVPICLPCGNGVCNQFENACNCPEDCQKESTVDKEYKGFDGIVPEEKSTEEKTNIEEKVEK
ncbi:MAG: hypothetical protein KBD53_10370 [Candidatus Omnitrophica bacterium]|nr:hypothetical protein [Candidatus Omnitrophota bacterium]